MLGISGRSGTNTDLFKSLFNIPNEMSTKNTELVALRGFCSLHQAEERKHNRAYSFCRGTKKDPTGGVLQENQPTPPWKKPSPEASISQHTLKWSKQVHWHTDCWARYATHICHFQKIKMGMSRRDSNLWFRWSEKSLKSKDKLHFCITKHFSVYVYQYCNLYCLYDTATHVHGSIVSNWYKNMFY